MPYEVEDGSWRLRWAVRIDLDPEIFPGGNMGEVAKAAADPRWASIGPVGEMERSVASAVVEWDGCNPSMGVSDLRVRVQNVEVSDCLRKEAWIVECSCSVDDAYLLKKAALDRNRDNNWGGIADVNLECASLEEWAFEYFVASNARCSPRAAGFAIVSCPKGGASMEEWSCAQESMELADATRKECAVAGASSPRL